MHFFIKQHYRKPLRITFFSFCLKKNRVLKLKKRSCSESGTIYVYIYQNTCRMTICVQWLGWYKQEADCVLYSWLPSCRLFE